MSFITNYLLPFGAIYRNYILRGANTYTHYTVGTAVCVYIPFGALLAAYSCGPGGVKVPV